MDCMNTHWQYRSQSERPPACQNNSEGTDTGMSNYGYELLVQDLKEEACANISGASGMFLLDVTASTFGGGGDECNGSQSLGQITISCP
jgi:hypothetical protein